MTDIIRKQIKALSFSLLSPEMIKKISAAKVITPELYDVDGYPVDGGLMDLRLGAIDPGVRCRTCGGGLKECLGHPGSIELARSIMHVKYVPIVELFLRSFCGECGKILLSEDDIKKYNVTERIKKSRDSKKCPHCGAAQEKVKLEKPTTFYAGKRRIFPTEIRERLVKIPDEQTKLVGVNPTTCRPEWGVLVLLIVPPVTVRPSITLESGERSEDDLTHKLSDIVRANQRLWENLNAGAPEVIIEDLWDLLQYHVTTFFDNTLTKIPPARHRSGQPLKTITERIKGKEGRIRHNLAGKRVNYSSRTVVSPDPFLEINEVGVPFEIAKVITVAESVNSMNIEKLKKLILSDEYPAANYVIRPDGKRKRITPELKQEIIEELSVGYIVERHLQDGDIVLFNRHPSLHRASLMAHYVRVLPHKTFRLHPATTFPYNADFDGDEMNIHSPQTEEARAEAKILLDVKQNMISPKNGCNLLGCITDAITGNYLLGKNKIEKYEADQLIFNAGSELEFSKKNIEGKELFAALLPKEINYEGTGEINSKLFGVEEGKIIKEIDEKLGRDRAIETLRNVFSVGTSYLSNSGFTISIEDLNVNEKTRKQTEEITKDAEDRTEKLINSYYDGTLEIIPGKNKEDSREIKILQILNEVRTKIGNIVKQEFPKENPVNMMILAGSSGSILNVTQIACCIGQQSLWSKRISFGYTKRTLSFFKENDLSPRARGFVYSSYMKGLKPYEFFFGGITGRDALMDTALRTPKSGYLYRRLANALQDLKVEYDGTVRDASGNIMQFSYGDDGYDVSAAHKKGKISPGEAIGMVTAQSFGEPSTQMALNVFHSAGVQEMQITSGLPRLIEIFDARKTPSTPMMEICLDKDYNNEKDARAIAEKIKEIRLKEVISEIKVNFADKKIEIALNVHSLRSVHMSAESIAEKLREKGFSKVKSRENMIYLLDDNANFKELYKTKEKIKEAVILGITGIAQILVVKREASYVILTAGSNLEEVFKIKGVNAERTTTNNIHEVAEVLGIESARQVIIAEIYKVIESQGLDIDERHLKFVADAMTTSGQVKGATRMGIISQKSSILARASFETPIKQFVNATIKASKDELASVIENIILNQPVPVGTGLPGLLVKVTGPLVRSSDKKNKEDDKKSKEEK
jgi:DNA-directed RNA polymerase subunit A'